MLAGSGLKDIDNMIVFLFFSFFSFFLKVILLQVQAEAGKSNFEHNFHIKKICQWKIHLVL